LLRSVIPTRIRVRRFLVENYTCSACNAKFNSKQELDGHVQREHQEAKEERKEAGAGATTSQNR